MILHDSRGAQRPSIYQDITLYMWNSGLLRLCGLILLSVLSGVLWTLTRPHILCEAYSKPETNKAVCLQRLMSVFWITVQFVFCPANVQLIKLFRVIAPQQFKKVAILFKRILCWLVKNTPMVKTDQFPVYSSNLLLIPFPFGSPYCCLNVLTTKKSKWTCITVRPAKTTKLLVRWPT